MIEIILGDWRCYNFFVYTIFNVTYILSKKRTSESMASFFRNTEGNLNAALSELKDNSRTEEDHPSDMAAVTGDVNRSPIP